MMMKIFLVLLMLLSLSGFTQQVTSLPVDDFKKNMNNGEVQLLDVRKPEEYKAGHLEKAFLADWLNKKDFEEKVQHLDKNKPVYVYCLAGSRSAAAATWLAEKGFTAIVNMQGGLNAWKKEGLPLQASVKVPQLNGEDYTRLVQSANHVLVDFGAEWCIPCKKMEPVVARFRKKHPGVKLVRIDAAVQEEITQKQKVEGLPLFILYQGGTEVWRHEGITTEEEFEKALELLK